MLDSSQVVNTDRKVNNAIKLSVRLLQKAAWGSMAASLTVIGSTIMVPTLSRQLCTIVFKCFGFSGITAAQVDDVMSKIVWSNLRDFMAQQVTQTVAIWGSVATLTLFTAVGGIPLAVTAPFLEIIPAARMITKCACDVILILQAAYNAGGRAATLKHIQESSIIYSARRMTPDTAGASVSRKHQVHSAVQEMFPIFTVRVWKGLEISSIQLKVEEIIKQYKFNLDTEHDLSRLSLTSTDTSLSTDLEDLKALKEEATRLNGPAELPGVLAVELPANTT
jgi:hypothetical protein